MLGVLGFKSILLAWINDFYTISIPFLRGTDIIYSLSTDGKTEV